MRGPSAPTNKVAAVGGTGVVVTLILQLMAQYFPSVHMPDVATMAMILTVITTAAGYITREAPQFIRFIEGGTTNPAPPAPAPGPVVSPTPPAPTAPLAPLPTAERPLNDWGHS